MLFAFAVFLVSSHSGYLYPYCVMYSQKRKHCFGVVLFWNNLDSCGSGSSSQCSRFKEIPCSVNDSLSGNGMVHYLGISRRLQSSGNRRYRFAANRRTLLYPWRSIIRAWKKTRLYPLRLPPFYSFRKHTSFFVYSFLCNVKIFIFSYK